MPSMDSTYDFPFPATKRPRLDAFPPIGNDWHEFMQASSSLAFISACDGVAEPDPSVENLVAPVLDFQGMTQDTLVCFGMVSMS